MTLFMSIDTLRIITILALANLEAQTVARKKPQTVELPGLERRGGVVPLAAVTLASQIVPRAQVCLA